MNTSYSRIQALLLTIPSVAVLLTCNSVDAQVYKWRDSRGVVQYSDKPPVAGFTKATRNEIVNALQKKELCADPLATKPKNTLTAALQNSTSKENTLNFFGITGIVGTATATATATGISGMAGTSLVSTAVASPRTVTATSPLPVATASHKPTAAASTLSLWAAAKPAASTGWFGSFGNVTTVLMPKPTVVATAPAPSPVLTTAPALSPVLAVTSALKPAPAPAPAPSPSVGANIIQVALMPAVDINKNIASAAGFSGLRIAATSEQAPVSGDGAFRISCAVSHMSNDDPLVYPNQQGAAHHHTFYGNTSLNYKSDLNNLSNVGNSTCNGGTMNRSAYWHPTLIDISTNAPVLPDRNEALFYYKIGFDGVPANLIKAPPKGLRMLTGNSKAVSAGETTNTEYVCMSKSTGNSNGMARQSSIPNCNVGDYMQMVVSFPQCWDGKNLDSPNHKDHMANPNGQTANKCPASHPVAIPKISLNMWFTITRTNQAANWRLASDNYAKSSPGGYSGHADWVNGWDEATMAGIVRNCLNPNKDAHAHLLCDGRMFY